MNGQLKRNIQKAFKTPELDEQKKAEFLKKVPQPPISMWQFILNLNEKLNSSCGLSQ